MQRQEKHMSVVCWNEASGETYRVISPHHRPVRDFRKLLRLWPYWLLSSAYSWQTTQEFNMLTELSEGRKLLLLFVASSLTQLSQQEISISFCKIHFQVFRPCSECRVTWNQIPQVAKHLLGHHWFRCCLRSWMDYETFYRSMPRLKEAVCLCCNFLSLCRGFVSLWVSLCHSLLVFFLLVCLHKQFLISTSSSHTLTWPFIWRGVEVQYWTCLDSTTSWGKSLAPQLLNTPLCWSVSVCLSVVCCLSELFSGNSCCWRKQNWGWCKWTNSKLPSLCVQHTDSAELSCNFLYTGLWLVEIEDPSVLQRVSLGGGGVNSSTSAGGDVDTSTSGQIKPKLSAWLEKRWPFK